MVHFCNSSTYVPNAFSKKFVKYLIFMSMGAGIRGLDGVLPLKEVFKKFELSLYG